MIKESYAHQINSFKEETKATKWVKSKYKR
jgi:hypothetical protein